LVPDLHAIEKVVAFGLVAIELAVLVFGAQAGAIRQLKSERQLSAVVLLESSVVSVTVKGLNSTTSEAAPADVDEGAGVCATATKPENKNDNAMPVEQMEGFIKRGMEMPDDAEIRTYFETKKRPAKGVVKPAAADSLPRLAPRTRDSSSTARSSAVAR
jgi:hypothetical protein